MSEKLPAIERAVFEYREALRNRAHAGNAAMDAIERVARALAEHPIPENWCPVCRGSGEVFDPENGFRKCTWCPGNGHRPGFCECCPKTRNLSLVLRSDQLKAQGGDADKTFGEIEKELDGLARKLAHGEITEDAAADAVGEICTRFGPSVVQALDAYYESRLAEYRKGQL